MTMTPEQIKNHIGEVWEADSGDCWHLNYVGRKHVVATLLLPQRKIVETEQVFTIDHWLEDNNLPQSLRKAKPRMVKAPGWVVLYGGNSDCISNTKRCFDEDTALAYARGFANSFNHVAIQAPGSDEMEVVKGF